MTEVYRQWPDELFYFSSASTTNVKNQITKLQRASKHVRALSDATMVESNGDEQQDIVVSTSYGQSGQRHKYRILHDTVNDRFVVQRNSGTDASKTWVELLRIDSSGNVTTTGTLSTDALTTTAGGVTLGGVLDANRFYLRNLDKVIGELRADTLRIHDGADFDLGSTVTFEADVNLRGNTLFYLKRVATVPVDQVSSAAVVQSGSLNVKFFSIGYNEKTADQTITGGAETDITSLTAIDLPNTNAVNTRKYLVHFTVNLAETSGSNNLTAIRLYNGANGTKADTLVYAVNIQLPASALGSAVSGMIRFTPGASTRTKIGLACNSVGNCTVQGAGQLQSTLTVQEVV